ncbi:MAG TPA: hypothetical protein VMG31_02165 [Verrucomicrobiae bacterium]|nr:hypothetical protein [Verrucomicrobiae bacterium]
MTIGWKVDVPEAEHFFERSPFRWWPFIADTILFFMILAVEAFILIRYWTRLPLVTVVFLAAVALGMSLLWTAALTAHQRVHEIHVAGMFGEIVPRSPVESVIRVAASMIHLGLFSAFLIAGILFMQIDRLLSR